MTWEIFLGISALFAFFIPLLTIAVKVTKTLTAIQVALDVTVNNLEEIKHENAREHERLGERINVLERSKCRFNHEERM